MKTFIEYLKLMRIHHYIKNVLIFLPLIFSGKLLDINLTFITLIGAISFSIMCSAIYIINDIADCKEDRKNERKKNRPIASGAISIKKAGILAVILILTSTILNIYISNKQITETPLLSFSVLCGYLLMNIAYSLKLKHIPIIDITILAFGFVFRVIYGATITGILISNWLYLTVLVFSFYMGLGKRRNELKQNGSEGRKVLERYSENFLNNNMYMYMTLGIVFYSLWCIDINSAINSFINVLYTVPIVMIICMKYNMTIEGKSSGDPVDVIFSDKILLALILIYSIIMAAILYM